MYIKAFFNFIRNYINKDSDAFLVKTFLLFCFVGAITFGIIFFKYSAPINLTEKEIQEYSSVSSTIANNGLENIDGKNEDYDISSSLPSKITITPEDERKDSIVFDFSSGKMEKTIIPVENTQILMFFEGGVLGVLVGALAYMMLYGFIYFIIAIFRLILFVWRGYKKELINLKDQKTDEE